MIVTRCPHCQTGFRVTPEQIKACDGRVRCGKCQQVFDAVENLITAQGVPSDAVAESGPPISSVAKIGADALADNSASAPEALAPEPPTPVIPAFLIRETSLQPRPEAPKSAPEDPPEAPLDLPAPPSPPPAAPPPTDSALASVAASPDTPEEAPARARAAGLSAARDSSEIPGFNKWSEGTLTSSGAVFAEPPRPVRWPYAVAALFFALALAGQTAVHFRSELAARLPAVTPVLSALCEMTGCRVGLPRDSELIGIESSELQTDAERGGLLVLVATLRNRAPFAQEFPAFELSLTDTRDQPLVRKVLSPADYLPAGTLARGGLAPGGEQAIRVWLDGQAVGAAGYRLYVFYP